MSSDIFQIFTILVFFKVYLFFHEYLSIALFVMSCFTVTRFDYFVIAQFELLVLVQFVHKCKLGCVQAEVFDG